VTVWHWLSVELFVMGLGVWELYALNKDKQKK
jgi:hypothetical protein